MGEPARVLDEPPAVPTKRGPTISVLTKVKARNLYLNQGLSCPTIAKECGISESVVRRWAERDGWTKERRTVYARTVAKQDARVRATEDQVVEAIASFSEQHALRALEKTGEALERTDEFAAKDFQSYTAGVKNLVQVVRSIREPGANTEQSANLSLNIFFAPPPAAKPSEAKQVEAVEVEAKRV